MSFIVQENIGNEKGNSQRNPKSIIKKRNRSKPGFWKTEQGYLKFVEKCSNSDKVLQFSKSTWKSTVTSNKSSVIVRCTICNPTVDRTVVIHKFVDKDTCGCGCHYKKCNQGGKKKWKHYSLEKVQKKCAADNYELLMNPNNWKNTIETQDSKFSIKCLDCAVEGETCCRKFYRQRCLCLSLQWPVAVDVGVQV